MNREEIVANLSLEFRRGLLVLGVLSQLKEAQYGYSLVQRLSERGMEVDQGTIYPLLRRLEKQGLLDSSWSLEDTRPRRYYVLSSLGKSVLDELAAEWQSTEKTMEKLLSTEE